MVNIRTPGPNDYWYHNLEVVILLYITQSVPCAECEETEPRGVIWTYLITK